VTSPPYWNILQQKRTADNKATRHYGRQETDLGSIADYEEFLSELQKVFQNVFEVLRPDRYCVVVLMDLRRKDRFYPFHNDVAKMMQSIGFILDDLIIWNRKAEYNNLRPLGYPSVFRINKVHEYVLIFKKSD
jgi:DNA modification methylase